MNEGFQYFDLLLLAIVAGFLILRLRSVLGRRTGHQEPPDRSLPEPGRASPREQTTDNVVNLPGPNAEAEYEAGADAPPPSDAVAAGLAQIRRSDPSFDARQFLDGARAAFTMIVDAFARGDTASLRPLLGDDLYDGFSQAIRERLAADLSQETVIHDAREATIVAADLEGSTARIAVRYVTEQINVTRNADGDVVGGDADKRDVITDVWVFERNTNSADPNWHLAETDE